MKRLYRSTNDKKLGGVCGGLGDYFNIDPVVFRIAFVLVSLAFFSGVVIYLLLWWLLPEQPTGSAPPQA